MKRKNIKVAGISLTLPFKLFRELKEIFKALIESIGYEALEMKYPTFLFFFLENMKKKYTRKYEITVITKW